MTRDFGTYTRVGSQNTRPSVTFVSSGIARLREIAPLPAWLPGGIRGRYEEM